MIEKEMRNQRLIGQQILIVRIMHSENKKVSKGGVSFIGVDDISDWMGCQSSDVIKLRDMNNQLDSFIMAASAARQYTQTMSANEYGYFLTLFNGCGRMYINIKMQGISVDVLALGEAFAKRISDMNIKVEDTLRTEASLTAGFDFFFDFFMETVRQAFREYDAEVIREMLCMKDEQFCKLKTYLGMK